MRGCPSHRPGTDRGSSHCVWPRGGAALGLSKNSDHIVNRTVHEVPSRHSLSYEGLWSANTNTRLGDNWKSNPQLFLSYIT